jgi:hypothetical protein
MLEVNGEVDYKRQQRLVFIFGRLSAFPDGDSVCWCLLWPGEKTEVCRHDCPTIVERRVYYGCNEQEVFDLLISGRSQALPTRWGRALDRIPYHTLAYLAHLEVEHEDEVKRREAERRMRLVNT